MKSRLAVILCALTLRAQEFPNPLNLPDGRIVWNPSRELCMQHGEIVTNITEASVVTNYPPNYAARLALVPMYQAAASNLGVYGMNPLAARTALKERASAETNLVTRLSIGEAATDLFFLREAVAKLGIDPDAAAGSCDPNVTTNAAQTNVVFRLRSP